MTPEESARVQRNREEAMARRALRVAGQVDASSTVVAKEAASASAALVPGLPVSKQASRQLYDFAIVIDLEATCDQPNNADPQEIIEFACAALSLRTLELVGSWRTYVKPTHHPRLSEFCVGLTGINQADVDAGVGLASALDGLVTWLRTSELLTTPADGDATERFVVCTWTDWDMERMLHGEAKWRRIELPPFLRRWVDLKSVFGETFKSAKGFNLAQSCASAGVAWDGRAHSGLDDARNTARLAAKLVERGAVLRPTGAFAGFEAPAPRQKTLAEAFGVAPPAPAKPRAGADGSCACGVAAKLRKVQRPGPNCGRCFYSCGAYTQRKGAVCDFFEWASADTVLPDEKGRRRRRSTD